MWYIKHPEGHYTGLWKLESAKNDSEKLCGKDPMISSHEKDDIVAAISSYR